MVPLLLDAPCGVDLRFDQVYDKIPELARSEADGLSRGVWERESKKSDWPAVSALCIDVLSTRTKDMQIAAWLSQALMHLHGLRGAALGWHIFSSLTMTFWSGIFPRMEDQDSEIRLCSVYWLTNQTNSWLTAYFSATTGERDALTALKANPADDLAALTSLLQVLLQLQLFLDHQLGQQPPLFHQLTDPLQKRLATLTALPQATLASMDGTVFAANQPMTATPIQLTFNSRDAAYAALGDIARQLAKSEPHSPVPMILEALVSWRDCQFNDLLTRMPQDKASLYELLKFFKLP
jgi:type VI secretion system protein ImpA